MKAADRPKIHRMLNGTGGELRVASSPFDHSPEFARLLRGEGQVSLDRIALEIAADAYPKLDAESYLATIEELVNRTRDRCGAKKRPREVLQQINWTLFVEEEIKGNRENYFDPRNSFLNDVLDRKLGIPISLSILYWTMAERLGLTVEAVSFPSHLMLRVQDETQAWFVDAYESGSLMDQERCEKRRSMLAIESLSSIDPFSTRLTRREVVARMLRGLKATYWNTHDVDSAILVQRRLVALNQADPYELRDLGVMYVQADRLNEAIDSLQAYLHAAPSPDEVRKFEALLAAIRNQVIHMN
jgi:regulator of sirC expression with transglutaminase-like and TPR domain